METQSISNNSAAFSLASAMSTLVQDTNFSDFTVTCDDKEWKLHSAILAIRSPFFKAAITNNMSEKLEMKIDIKDFDPETMEEVLNFMYGKPIENAPISFLFEAAERFQMDDLKNDVVNLAKQRMDLDNVIEFAQLAEMYNVEGFLSECADFIVKKEVYTKEDLSPKLVKIVFSILNKNLKHAKTETSQKLKFAKTEASQTLKDAKSEASQKLQDVKSEVSRLKEKLSKFVEPTVGITKQQNFYGCTMWGCKIDFMSKAEAVNHIIEDH